MITENRDYENVFGHNQRMELERFMKAYESGPASSYEPILAVESVQ